jgi:hypothetical protein
MTSPSSANDMSSDDTHVGIPLNEARALAGGSAACNDSFEVVCMCMCVCVCVFACFACNDISRYCVCVRLFVCIFMCLCIICMQWWPASLHTRTQGTRPFVHQDFTHNDFRGLCLCACMHACLRQVAFSRGSAACNHSFRGRAACNHRFSSWKRYYYEATPQIQSKYLDTSMHM